MNRSLLTCAAFYLALSSAALMACGDDDDDDTSSSSSSSSSSGANASSSSSSGSTSSSSGANASSSSSSGATSSSSGSSSGGVEALNGCTEYVDNTGKDTINIDPWTNPLEDSNKCSMISAGTTVVWHGNFGAHPLESKGGDANNPIDAASPGADQTESVTFDTAGTFGYDCLNHPSAMRGAFQVVEN